MFLSNIKKLFTTQDQPVAPKPRKTTFWVEALEGRDVPAVVGLTAMTPILTNGVLTIVGNSSNNTIEVTKSGSTIRVLGKSFASSAVTSIAIDGQGGNDTITVSESITQKAYLYGGFGSDTIRGGAGADVIYGGGQADYLYGRGGDDAIYGGTSNDRIDGGSGNDSALDYHTGDIVTSASTLIGEGGSLTAYSKTSYTGQVIYEVLRLVNLERAKVGKAALTLDAGVNTAASSYAKLLDNLDVPIGQGISHAFSGHTKPMLTSRLDANLLTYNAAAENNGYRLNTAGLTATRLAYELMYGPNGTGGLMNSAGHKANILNGAYTKIGLGLSGSTATGYYLTQVFTG